MVLKAREPEGVGRPIRQRGFPSNKRNLAQAYPIGRGKTLNFYSPVENPQNPDARKAGIYAVAAETMPFAVKNTYTLISIQPGQRRGFHAHRKLEQVIFVLIGKVKFELTGSDFIRREWIAKQGGPGIYIGRVVWREFEAINQPASLLVFASESHDPSDYITSYSDFKRECGL